MKIERLYKEGLAWLNPDNRIFIILLQKYCLGNKKPTSLCLYSKVKVIVQYFSQKKTIKAAGIKSQREYKILELNTIHKCDIMGYFVKKVKNKNAQQ